jgi:HEAT repeat protein
MATHKKEISVRQLIGALLDDSTPFPPNHLRRFSDLEGADLEAVQQAWPKVNPNRRVAIMDDLEELAETDTLMMFDNFVRTVLNDSEAGVRARALTLLWEDEDEALVPIFLDMLENDPGQDVRSAAASALGKFIYLGEMEELPEQRLHQVEDHLIAAARSSPNAAVRRSALEALGFSSREEVPELLREAYATDDPDWLASALFAMGRSYDKSYEPEVKRMIRHPKGNVQLEAVRAAGELELTSTTRLLLDLLEEEAQDPETRYAVIWSLSQIGGEEPRSVLEKLLEETDDEEEAEWLENAIDNLTLTDTGHAMNLLDIDLTDEDLLGGIVDLSKPENDEDEDLDDVEGDEEV